MKRIYLKPIIKVIYDDECLLAAVSGVDVDKKDIGEPDYLSTPMVGIGDEKTTDDTAKDNQLGWDDLSGW